MDTLIPVNTRVPAAIGYIPIIGWLYVPLLQRKNQFAMFHVRQSIGLWVFLAAAFIAWALVTWLLAWIPLAFILGIALFALVIAAGVFGIVTWIMGIANALRGRMALLPMFGQIANRL